MKRLAIGVCALLSVACSADFDARATGGGPTDGPDAGRAEDHDIDGSPAPDPGFADAGIVGSEAPEGIPASVRSLYDERCYAGRAPSDVMCRGCAPIRSCCVGSGACCGPVTSSPLPVGDVPFATCSGDVESCLATRSVDTASFGTSFPWVSGNGLHPGGSLNDDGGLVLGSDVDLTDHAVAVTATFGAPTDCSTGCLESVAVGLTTQSIRPGAVDARVGPLAALLYSGARQQVSLLLGHDVAAVWLAPDESTRWTLRAEPTGEIVVTRDDSAEELARAAYEPASAARLVVWGRSTNTSGSMTGGELGARLTSLDVSTELCDIPTAWDARARVPMERGGSAWTPDFGRPSVARHGGSAHLAIDATAAPGEPPRIYFGRRMTETSPFAFRDESDVPDAMERVPGYAEAGVSDPALVREGDRWLIYFTAESADGKRSIGRASMGDGDPGFRMDGTELLAADLFGWEALDQPTVARSEGGMMVMIVRAHRDEQHELVAFARPEGSLPDAWAPVPETNDLGHLTRRGVQRIGSAFDVDEIAWPSLVVHDGAWQLHYAGRRGTRWAIGLLISDRLVRWRAPSEGAVLRRSQTDWERVGVLAPAAVSRATESLDRVELFYVGSDGARPTLAGTGRDATDDGSF